MVNLPLNERKLNRLRKYNYSQAGRYYITICTKNREEFFGEIENGEVRLNQYGIVSINCWKKIPKHFSDVVLEEYVIMPNHIHGIIIIRDRHRLVGNNDRCSLQNKFNNDHQRNMELLPKIISQFKSSVSRFIRLHFDNYKFGWQKSFYDHIIRNEIEYQRIKQYIMDNPKNWSTDRNNVNV